MFINNNTSTYEKKFDNKKLPNVHTYKTKGTSQVWLFNKLKQQAPQLKAIFLMPLGVLKKSYPLEPLHHHSLCRERYELSLRSSASSRISWYIKAPYTLV